MMATQIFTRYKQNETHRMSDTGIPPPSTLSERPLEMFPTLTPAQIARIARHGRKRQIARGEVLIEAGPDLSAEELHTAKWPLARAPYLLESSLPGIFAVGDVRSGNIKRVASAVGEGSIAVAFVHQVLQN